MTVRLWNIPSTEFAVSYYGEENYNSQNPSQFERSQWHGKGAELLGLRGRVDIESLNRVLNGDTLDGRCIGQRKGQTFETAIRRKTVPGIDATFSPPKDVSLLYYLGGDERIQLAHEGAVSRTLNWVERKLSVPRNPKHRRKIWDEDRKIVVAKFNHDISRENDPHLHTHALILNMINDLGKWYAQNFYMQFTYLRTIEFVYDSYLKRSLCDFGYLLNVDSKKRNFWFVSGVAKQAIDMFSTRHYQIIESLEDQKFTNRKVQAKVLSETRKDKSAYTLSDLQLDWEERGKEWISELKDLCDLAKRRTQENLVEPLINDRIPSAEDYKTYRTKFVDDFFQPTKNVENEENDPYTLKRIGSERDYATRAAVSYGLRFAEKYGRAIPIHGIRKSASRVAAIGITIDDIDKQIQELIKENKESFKFDVLFQKLTTPNIIPEEERFQPIIKLLGGDLLPPILKTRSESFKNSDLSPNQEDAIHAILSSKKLLIFIEGYPGSGEISDSERTSKLPNDLISALDDNTHPVIGIMTCRSVDEKLAKKPNFRQYETFETKKFKRDQHRYFSEKPIILFDTTNLLSPLQLHKRLKQCVELNPVKIVLFDNLNISNLPVTRFHSSKIIQNTGIETAVVKDIDSIKRACEQTNTSIEKLRSAIDKIGASLTEDTSSSTILKEILETAKPHLSVNVCTRRTTGSKNKPPTEVSVDRSETRNGLLHETNRKNSEFVRAEYGRTIETSNSTIQSREVSIDGSLTNKEHNIPTKDSKHTSLTAGSPKRGHSNETETSPNSESVQSSINRPTSLSGSTGGKGNGNQNEVFDEESDRSNQSNDYETKVNLSKIEQKNPIGNTKRTSFNDGQPVRGRLNATEASRMFESNISSVCSSIPILKPPSDTDLPNQIQKFEDTSNRSIQSEDITRKGDLLKSNKNNQDGDTRQINLDESKPEQRPSNATETSRKYESNISSVYSSIPILNTPSDVDIPNQYEKFEYTSNRSIQSKDITSKSGFTNNNKNNQDGDTKQTSLNEGKPEQGSSNASETSQSSNSPRSSKNLPSAFSNSSSMDKETAESDSLGDIFNKSFRTSSNQEKRPYSHNTSSVWPESKISVIIPNPILRQKYNELIRLKLIELEVLGKTSTVVNLSHQVTRSKSQLSENIRIEQDHIQEKISSADQVGSASSETNLATNTEHSGDPSGKYGERYSIETSDATHTSDATSLNLGEQNDSNANKEKMSLSAVERNRSSQVNRNDYNSTGSPNTSNDDNLQANFGDSYTNIDDKTNYENTSYNESPYRSDDTEIDNLSLDGKEAIEQQVIQSKTTQTKSNSENVAGLPSTSDLESDVTKDEVNEIHSTQSQLEIRLNEQLLIPNSDSTDTVADSPDYTPATVVDFDNQTVTLEFGETQLEFQRDDVILKSLEYGYARPSTNDLSSSENLILVLHPQDNVTTETFNSVINATDNLEKMTIFVDDRENVVQSLENLYSIKASLPNLDPILTAKSEAEANLNSPTQNSQQPIMQQDSPSPRLPENFQSSEPPIDKPLDFEMELGR